MCVCVCVEKHVCNSKIILKNKVLKIHDKDKTKESERECKRNANKQIVLGVEKQTQCRFMIDY